jgi:hypothetical protein
MELAHTVPDLPVRKSAAITQARRADLVDRRAPHVLRIERSPILPESEEGQDGSNDDDQTDEIDNLVHVTLRSSAP